MVPPHGGREDRRSEPTVRLTVAQATFGSWPTSTSSATASGTKFFAGCFGIFGHGNVAGFGQALLRGRARRRPGALRYYQGRNEQAMVHSAVGLRAARGPAVSLGRAPPASAPARPTCSPARRWPRSTGCRSCCCPPTSSPPGWARRCCRSSSMPAGGDVSVNDAFRPLSRYFDRVWRPEQLPSALLGAMRVLTDPVETGAVTVALPAGRPGRGVRLAARLFAERIWHVARPVPEPVGDRAGGRRHPVGARAPLIVAGGGVIYSEATEALAAFVEQTGIPVAETQAGKGALPLRPPAGGGRDRLDRHDRGQRAGRRGRRGHRHRHPLQRFHHRIAHRVRLPRRQLRQRQRRSLRRGQAGRASAWSPTPARR